MQEIKTEPQIQTPVPSQDTTSLNTSSTPPPTKRNRKPVTPVHTPPNYWKWLCCFACVAVTLWVVQWSEQYYFYTNHNLERAFIRSFGLSGATLISISLFLSAVFKWFPKTAKYWRFRRYAGVWGTVFIGLHIYSVLNFLYSFHLKALYFSLNPFVNPVIFGSFGFVILLILAATSTDWAMNALNAKRWKVIHRFVYIAYWASVSHFLLANPYVFKTAPGIFLLGVTALALGGELFWFIKIASKKKFISLGAAIGLGIILLYAITIYMIITMDLYKGLL